MREWLGQLNVLTWLFIFAVAISVLRRLLDRLSGPAAAPHCRLARSVGAQGAPATPARRTVGVGAKAKRRVRSAGCRTASNWMPRALSRLTRCAHS